MITERDLKEAIAECEGQRSPTSTTCVKLAAFYAVKDRLYPSAPAVYQKPVMAYTEEAPTVGIQYDSGTEFSRLIKGKESDEVFSVIDELMDALMAVNPRLYDFTVRKLKQV